ACGRGGFRKPKAAPPAPTATTDAPAVGPPARLAADVGPVLALPGHAQPGPALPALRRAQPRRPGGALRALPGPADAHARGRPMTARALVLPDRAAWLAARREGIGGSDAAAALGLSPYRTPLELYAE